jgi:hypothetical protein
MVALSRDAWIMQKRPLKLLIGTFGGARKKRPQTAWSLELVLIKLKKFTIVGHDKIMIKLI